MKACLMSSAPSLKFLFSWVHCCELKCTRVQCTVIPMVQCTLLLILQYNSVHCNSLYLSFVWLSAHNAREERAVQYSTKQYNTFHNIAVQYSVMEYNKVHYILQNCNIYYSAMHCSAGQYTTIENNAA